MIGIIDYGMGNLGSVSNACAFLKLPARIITSPAEMKSCGAVILPGVGAFGDCLQHLTRNGFVSALRNWVQSGKPYLGLCLGLQVLYASSDESPGVEGLSLLPGRVRRFQLPADFKVPQIGWNRVMQKRKDCPLFEDISDGTFFYFVHSYYVDTPARDTVAGVTDYGLEYTTVVWKENVMAVQFHPEKSQDAGLKMLDNFSRWMNREAATR